MVLHGENAQGKTNTLEAIWYLCALRPLQSHRPAEMVGWDSPSFELAGWTTTDGLQHHRRVGLEQKKRTILLDGQRCHRLESYFEDLRAIAFTPADGEIITGAPEHRRRWVDRAAFTARPAHLSIVRGFQKVLANKGAELRRERPDSLVLDVLDEQLVHLGSRLVERRATLLAELDEHVRTMLDHLTGASVALTLQLRSRAGGDTLEAREQSLRLALAEVRSAEIRRHRCLAGPQSDDVRVHLQGRSARRYASRGQVRTLVLALKLAELLAARERGSVPVFLLDDLSSELDRGRTGRLVDRLVDLGAQVIVTTTDPSHVTEGRDALRIRVEAGRLHPG